MQWRCNVDKVRGGRGPQAASKFCRLRNFYSKYIRDPRLAQGCQNTARGELRLSRYLPTDPLGTIFRNSNGDYPETWGITLNIGVVTLAGLLRSLRQTQQLAGRRTFYFLSVTQENSRCVTANDYGRPPAPCQRSNKVMFLCIRRCYLYIYHDVTVEAYKQYIFVLYGTILNESVTKYSVPT